MKVPSGFVLEVSVFQSYLAENGLSLVGGCFNDVGTRRKWRYLKQHSLCCSERF
jgi:hypothetical protein